MMKNEPAVFINRNTAWLMASRFVGVGGCVNAKVRPHQKRGCLNGYQVHLIMGKGRTLILTEKSLELM